MEARLLQQTFMGMAHMTRHMNRMKSDRHVFKHNFKDRLVQPRKDELDELSAYTHSPGASRAWEVSALIGG